MADYCMQCNIAMFFGPYSDFDHFGKRGQLTPEDTARGVGMLVLCEGCGPIYVDHLGRCMCKDCIENGHTGMAETMVRVEKWLARRSGRMGWAWRVRDRFLGTPWEPGYIHEIRWRWHDWRDHRRGETAEWWNELSGVDMSDGKSTTKETGGEASSEHDRGTG